MKFFRLLFLLLPCWGALAQDFAPYSQIVSRLKGELSKELLMALQTGGPENAIQVCRDKAPAIASDLSKNLFDVGRTSHKLRNPKNAPRDWVKPYLEKYKGLNPPGLKAKKLPMNILVDLPEGRKGYLEPLFIQPLCVQCHGEKLAPELEKKIKALYPSDQAFGFKENEFRGFVWVESK